MTPATREKPASSTSIDRYRPRNAYHPVPLQDLLDQKAPASGTSKASRARFMFVVEATQELRPAATVTRLHEDRPASLLCRQQLDTPRFEGSRQSVKDGIWGHAALWHGLRAK